MVDYGFVAGGVEEVELVVGYEAGEGHDGVFFNV